MHSQLTESVAKPILLVEDDEVFSRVLTRALERRNFQVIAASSLEEANTQLRSSAEASENAPLGHAILDLNLGGHSSLALIPVLRKLNPQIHILMLTGYASIATAVEAIKLGASNYLAKPADMDEIMAALLDEAAQANVDSASAEASDSIGSERMSVRRLEWEHIQKVLQDNHGNISATARQLNMHRRTLQRKLQKRPVAK